MASFNISQFTANMKGGGARPNLFKLRIPSIPSSVSVRTGLSDIEFFCKSVSGLPTSTLGTIEIPYFGRTIKFAGDREFAELTTTIINEEDMKVRNIMDSWINSMNNMKDNTSKTDFGSRNDFSSIINLTTFKKDGDIDQQFAFQKCWPSAVSSIDLNWDSTNSIQEFTITWQYDNYQHINAF